MRPLCNLHWHGTACDRQIETCETNVFLVVDPWNDVFCSLRCDRTCAEKTVSVQIYNRVPAFNTHFSKWLVVPN